MFKGDERRSLTAIFVGPSGHIYFARIKKHSQRNVESVLAIMVVQ